MTTALNSVLPLMYPMTGGSLVVNAVIGLFFGPTAYYLALLYTASCAVVFMARTLSNIMGGEQAAMGARSEHRNHLLWGTSLLQLLLMWYLGYGGDM